MPEPTRVPRAIVTVNQQILNETIRHSHLLENLGNDQVRQVLEHLERRVFPRILGRVAEFGATGYEDWDGRLRTGNKEYKRLQAEIRKAIQSGAEEALGIQQGQLGKVAATEAAWQVQVIEKSLPIRMKLDRPPRELAEAWEKSRPMQGRHLKDWYADLARDTQRRVSQGINTALQEGRSIPDMTRMLRGTRKGGFSDGILEATRRQAEMIARTSTAHALQEARQRVFDANSRVIKAVRWSAALDAVTCRLCGPKDGARFEIGKGPRPPLHPNCRCQVVAITKSWKELGITEKDFPFKEPEGIRSVKNYTDAKKAMRGEVPGTTTYGQWLKDQPLWVQKQALGKKRAELFRSGKVEIGQFVRDDRVLTLDQLAKIEGISI